MANYYRKWTRADVQKSVNDAKNQAVALRESCLAAWIDSELNQQTRAARVAGLIARMGKKVQENLERAAGMIEEVRDRLKYEAELDTQRAQTAEHWLCVQDCVKTLETHGARMSREEFMALLEPIRFDVESQTTIKAACATGGMNKWQAGAWAVELFVPVLNRAKAVAELELLAARLRSCWNGFDTFDKVTGTEPGRVFCDIERALNRWNDVLTECN